MPQSGKGIPDSEDLLLTKLLIILKSCEILHELLFFLNSLYGDGYSHGKILSHEYFRKEKSKAFLQASIISKMEAR